MRHIVELGIDCERQGRGAAGELSGAGGARHLRTATATSLPRPFRDPASLFTFSARPASCVSSAGSAWDGVFLADVTAASSGEYHHAYRGVIIHHWRTPVRTRPTVGDGTWRTLAPGFTVRVPGDEDHGEWCEPCQAHVLAVAPERVEAVLGAPWERTGLVRWRGSGFERPFVSHVLAAMMRECEAGYPSGALAGDALLVALLSHLDGRAGVARPPRARALGRRLDLVFEYIDANLARPLRLAELAGVAGLGVRRFGTLFAAETGWPPHRYVVRRRVERAKSLMLDTRLSLAHISVAVGFSDQAQFSKVFRHHVGETPSAYRRR